MFNKDIANAFRKAKNLMNDTRAIRGPRFICWALEDARDAGHINKAAYQSAKEIIEQRLDGQPTVERWLFKNVPESHEHGVIPNAFATDRLQVVQEYRHRWLDALIEEFDGKK